MASDRRRNDVPAASLGEREVVKIFHLEFSATGLSSRYQPPTGDRRHVRVRSSRI